MRRLVIAVHDGTDQLACAHIAESVAEEQEVATAANVYGPVWTFDLTDDDPLQYWNV